MKLTSPLLAGTAILCLSLGFAVASQAQSAAGGSPTITGPSKIASINLQEVIATSAEGKKAGADLEARFAPKEKELQNAQNQLQALQKQLSDGGDTMSPQAKADLTAQIQTKQRDLQQSVQNAEADFQDAQTEVLNTIGAKVSVLVKNYAEQHGYSAVIDLSMKWPQNPVLYFNPGTDITSDIVKLYDQAHPVGAAPKPDAGPASHPAGQ